MLRYLCFFLFLSSLYGSIDPSISSYEERPKKHTDLYDFSGNFPQLENIDIDAKRKMRVEVILPGMYPVLKRIHYEGSFGSLTTKLTGSFPLLEEVDFVCTTAAMKLDLSGKWEKNATIHIKGGAGEIEVLLPKETSLVIHTKTGIKGKVKNQAQVKKQGRGWLNKTFTSVASNSALPHLALHIEATDGTIILK